MIRLLILLILLALNCAQGQIWIKETVVADNVGTAGNFADPYGIDAGPCAAAAGGDVRIVSGANNYDSGTSSWTNRAADKGLSWEGGDGCANGTFAAGPIEVSCWIDETNSCADNPDNAACPCVFDFNGGTGPGIESDREQWGFSYIEIRNATTTGWDMASLAGSGNSYRHISVVHGGGTGAGIQAVACGECNYAHIFINGEGTATDNGMNTGANSHLEFFTITGFKSTGQFGLALGNEASAQFGMFHDNEVAINFGGDKSIFSHNTIKDCDVDCIQANASRSNYIGFNIIDGAGDEGVDICGDVGSNCENNVLECNWYGTNTNGNKNIGGGVTFDTAELTSPAPAYNDEANNDLRTTNPQICAFPDANVFGNGNAATTELPIGAAWLSSELPNAGGGVVIRGVR